MIHFPIERTVTRAWLKSLERSTKDVLSSSEELKQRHINLYKALAITYSNRGQVIFWIENDSYCMPLKSRAIAMGDRSVFLEHNVRVPINSICRIQFL